MNGRTLAAAALLALFGLARAWALFAVTAAVAVAWWLLRLRLHPFGRCWRCRGGRRNKGSDDEQWGFCGRCGGDGQRIRFGARWVRPDLRR